MKLLDLTLASPAENLACDEALLDRCEDGAGEELLRFWEPHNCFVVVGHANRVATEVNLAACEARDVPVLRRCSGGGTVVQGPGCLNYTLVLRITDTGPTRTIRDTNQFILERNRAAIENLLARSGRRRETAPSKSETRDPKCEVALCGHTDLAIAGRKFSGNSQRRRRRFLLFHGTFLLDFDITLVQALLPPPSRQPEYRRHRSHGEFLTNLALPAASVKAELARAWHATAPQVDFPRDQIEMLAREKYATRAWSFKF
jgi:lipoate-protein ligase A